MNNAQQIVTNRRNELDKAAADALKRNIDAQYDDILTRAARLPETTTAMRTGKLHPDLVKRLEGDGFHYGWKRWHMPSSVDDFGIDWRDE